jgi:hypothetical protein
MPISARFSGLISHHLNLKYARKLFLKRISTTLALFCIGTSSLAEQPLSAIEWLNNVVTLPAVQPNPYFSGEPPIKGTTKPALILVEPLGDAKPDSVGLLPSSTTSLPETLWQASTTSDLTALLARIPTDTLPAIQTLYYSLLLAEAEAPINSGPEASFLKARVRALVEFGAVEPALALLKRAGPETKPLFDQWFNLSLLSGDETQACAILRDQPELSQSYPTRIYCSARAGDWPTAALIYDSANALNLLTKAEAELLAQFLDPETIDSSALPNPPHPMTPLLFRLYEAAGAPLPTRGLPRAYAMADLRNTGGWKANIEAAERLTRSGAVAPNRLIGFYTSRKPAASGGVWDRVAAVQRFDKALVAGNVDGVAATLPKAWEMMRGQGLEVAFAQLFSPQLQALDLPAKYHPLTLRIGLLSTAYKINTDNYVAADKDENFMLHLARGTPDIQHATSELQTAIAIAFAATSPARDHEMLLRQGKIGQAILSAAIGLDQASSGNLAGTTASLATLRAVGLEDTARRAALQLLILERFN